MKAAIGLNLFYLWNHLVDKAFFLWRYKSLSRRQNVISAASSHLDVHMQVGHLMDAFNILHATSSKEITASLLLSR